MSSNVLNLACFCALFGLIISAPSSSWDRDSDNQGFFITDNDVQDYVHKIEPQTEDPMDSLYIWEQFSSKDQKSRLMTKLKSHVENMCKCSNLKKCQVDEMLEHGENKLKNMNKEEIDRMDPQVNNEIFHKMMEGHEMMDSISQNCLSPTTTTEKSNEDRFSYGARGVDMIGVMVPPPSDFRREFVPQYTLKSGPSQYVLPPNYFYTNRRRSSRQNGNYFQIPKRERNIFPMGIPFFMNQNSL